MNLADLISIIDSGADSIVHAVVGERTEEYRIAESEAMAYRDGGYAGEIPLSVESWANPKKWTGQQAADNILATAAQWRSAQAGIRKERLAHKERARNGEDAAAVLASWLAFAKALRTKLGV
jgi:hypothetical protein